MNDKEVMVIDKEKKPLTVTQLIELLQKMPPDAPVFHEGCDCYGSASDVELQKDGRVLIGRHP